MGGSRSCATALSSHLGDGPVAEAGTRPLRAPAPWPRHPGHPRHPRQRLLGASRWEQAHWDNAHLARCVRGQGQSMQRAGRPLSQWLRAGQWPCAQARPATVLGVLGVLGVLARLPSNEILAGGPPTPSGIPDGVPVASNAAAWKAAVPVNACAQALVGARVPRALSEECHLAGEVGEFLARAAHDLRGVDVEVVRLQVLEDLVGAVYDGAR